MANGPTVPGEGGATRKPYETPQLEVYGDIREIAKAVGMTGMSDGATHGSTKTS